MTTQDYRNAADELRNICEEVRSAQDKLWADLLNNHMSRLVPGWGEHGVLIEDILRQTRVVNEGSDAGYVVQTNMLMPFPQPDVAAQQAAANMLILEMKMATPS